MSLTERGRRALLSAENNLRSLVAEAASQGDYESATLFLSWAQAVRDIAGQGTPGPHRAVGRLQQTPSKTPRPALSEAKRNAAKVAPHKTYPFFFRRKGQIVKVGWSKREKKEYQHKAPLTVLEALSSALASVGADGRVFSTDQILPLKDASNNSEFPTYQVYVCLALLKDAHLIEQHGRQGYSIPNIHGFTNASKAVLQELRER